MKNTADIAKNHTPFSIFHVRYFVLLCLGFLFFTNELLAQDTAPSSTLDSIPEKEIKLGKGRVVFEKQTNENKSPKEIKKEERLKRIQEIKNSEKVTKEQRNKNVTPEEKTGIAKLFDRNAKKAPLRAVLLSAALPGAGQAFNRRYWKIPIVAGGVGATLGLIVANTKLYKRYRMAYLYRVDGDSLTVDNYEGLYSDSNLKAIRNIYQKNVELSYIAFVGVYVLTGVDAFVDAHLQTFDVSEDLSMRIAPKLAVDPFRGQTTIGVGLTLLPNTKKPKPPIIW